MGPAEPTMSSSTSKSFVVPKLARDGTNWVTWKSQTLATLASTRGAKRHLEGTARIPPLVSSGLGPGSKAQAWAGPGRARARRILSPALSPSPTRARARLGLEPGPVGVGCHRRGKSSKGMPPMHVFT
ncbi:hypothetical protein JB92DRAFT_1139838 [Gautieria morchelliformis]|nr:hypothetical protein JB92DRAFT_1139838 [Gautieria morchelliformis]